MMFTTHRLYAGIVAVVLTLWFLPATQAEVAVDYCDQFARVIIMGSVVDEIDPIGQVVWQPIRPISATRVLNAAGYARGDGRPDIKVKSISENLDPVGVWAYNAGVDHDIAFSEWNGTSWTPTTFLTSSTDDELDPRLAVEGDGTVHVVWWTAGC